MARDSYNWWRRYPKRSTLNKSVPLKERIEHGDYEVSQYLDEAEVELETLERIKDKIRLEGERKNWGKQTIEHDIREKTNQYRRRYNRLMKDYAKDEFNILYELREELKKEFNDYWEYLYQEWLDGNLEDLTVSELYEEYKLIDKIGLDK